MRSLVLFQNYLWVAPCVFQVALILLMVRRKLHREFPFFFLYNIESALGAMLLFGIYLSIAHVNHQAWDLTYFVELPLNTVLRFAVIYEIFVYVFDHYPALQRLGRPLFRTCLLLLLAIALGLAVVSRQHEQNLTMAALHLFEQTASMLQVGLLMVLFAVSNFIGLSWRNYVFGMALGLGFYASVKLAAAALQSSKIDSGDIYVNLTVMGAFHVAVLM